MRRGGPGDPVGGDDQGRASAQRVSEEVALGTIALTETHGIDAFCCKRSERVVRFIQHFAHRYVRQSFARVFVWPSPDDPTRILGYYCLSAGVMNHGNISNALRRSTPGSVDAPMVKIGYMGRDDVLTQKGFGEILLLDAALRVSRIADIGIWGLMLDAENDGLVPWYRERNFKSSTDNARAMYGPLNVFLAARSASPA